MVVYARLGGPEQVGAARAVYERSNLVRRRGDWPSRASRLEQVTANLRDAASWFLIGHDGSEIVAMALVLPFRTDRGVGPVVPGASFLDLIYVLPERWGEGIGGVMLDAVIEEAGRRSSRRIYLWTHENENERAHRLYLSRAFSRTGVAAHDDEGEPVAEWSREG